ncbi:ATPase [Streptomyces antibioticus]|uniref:RapZ C-terminal domain-containing protein n=1 Tax=Streptomyces antibioticus TaxID=1890 RepID=UPI003710D04C
MPDTASKCPVRIISFGYLHDSPPAAHLTVDLRDHFRDPHIAPELRHMTADDAPVRAAVLATAGIRDLIEATALAVAAFAAGPSTNLVTVAVGCAGGRHRAPTFARRLSAHLAGEAYDPTVQHRDLHKPVVQRRTQQHEGS